MRNWTLRFHHTHHNATKLFKSRKAKADSWKLKRTQYHANMHIKWFWSEFRWLPTSRATVVEAALLIVFAFIEGFAKINERCCMPDGCRIWIKRPIQNGDLTKRCSKKLPNARRRTRLIRRRASCRTQLDLRRICHIVQDLPWPIANLFLPIEQHPVRRFWILHAWKLKNKDRWT